MAFILPSVPRIRQAGTTAAPAADTSLPACMFLLPRRTFPAQNRQAYREGNFSQLFPRYLSRTRSPPRSPRPSPPSVCAMRTKFSDTSAPKPFEASKALRPTPPCPCKGRCLKRIHYHRAAPTKISDRRYRNFPMRAARLPPTAPSRLLFPLPIPATIRRGPPHEKHRQIEARRKNLPHALRRFTF